MRSAGTDASGKKTRSDQIPSGKIWQHGRSCRGICGKYRRKIAKIWGIWYVSEGIAGTACCWGKRAFHAEYGHYAIPQRICSGARTKDHRGIGGTEFLTGAVSYRGASDSRLFCQWTRWGWVYDLDQSGRADASDRNGGIRRWII